MQHPIHPLPEVQSEHIGAGTRIWQYVIVLPRVRIGINCDICAYVMVENDVILGNRVMVKSGVQLWEGLRVDDEVFIGSNSIFKNDRLPRSKHHPSIFPETTKKAGLSIGGACGYSSWDHDRLPRHVERWRLGDTLGARRRDCGRKSRSNRSLCWARP